MKISIRWITPIVLLVAAVVAAFIFTFTIQTIKHNSLIEKMRQDSAEESEAVFNTLYETMRNGWNKDDIHSLIESLNKRYPATKIAIYRGDIVAGQFGEMPGERAIVDKDPVLRKALAEGDDITNQVGGYVRFLHPLRAKAECLACHTQSHIGAVHGVIEIIRPVSSTESVLDSLIFNIITIIFLSMSVIFVLLYSVLHEYVSKPIIALTERIRIMFDEVSTMTIVDESSHVQEISNLASTFNQMLRIVHDREKGLLDREESLKLAAKMFETSGDGILITNAHNLIVAANPAFLRMCGYDLESILNKNPKIFSSGKHGKEFYQGMWGALLTQGKWSGELTDRHRGGKVYDKYTSIEVVRDQFGEITNYISTHSNNMDRKIMEENIHYLAYYDALTGLPNRALLKDRMTQALTTASRNNTEFSILFLDLDRFKYINDTLGHDVGDGLLKAIAERLEAVVRNVDTVARIGGDEFVVVLSTTNSIGAATVAQHILKSLESPILVFDREIVSKVSIGIATYPEDGEDVYTLTKHADIAMYNAKSTGRNTYRNYNPDMSAQSKSVFATEQDICLGLERKEFFLEYQPKLNILSGQVTGVEALVRWRHPEKGTIYPTDFITIAEETGQIVKLGEWVLREACTLEKYWMDRGLDIKMSINISISQLLHTQFTDVLRSAIEDIGVSAGHLDLEITEGLMVDCGSTAISTMSSIRGLGVSLSIDDFGTGFSNLRYLQHMPVSQLKIDRAFIKDIENNAGDLTIVKAIIALAKHFGLNVIAEGVETEAQLEILKALGCDDVQGFLFGRPMSEDDIQKYVAKNLGKYAT